MEQRLRDEDGRPSWGKAAWAGVALAIAFVVGSSTAAYGFFSGYFDVFPPDGAPPDENLDVDVRIEKLNLQPQNFAVVVASVKVQNKSPSEIKVTTFTVQVWSDPEQRIQYGQDTRGDVSLPAENTRILKQNSKILNFDAFVRDLKGTKSDVLEDGRVFVVSYIQWTHFGQTHERFDAVYLDVSPWAFVLS